MGARGAPQRSIKLTLGAFSFYLLFKSCCLIYDVPEETRTEQWCQAIGMDY